MDLARRSVTSVAWNALASMGSVVILFIRSVLLARLLPVEIFGVYALAGSVVRLTARIPNFGMGGAFLHRAPEVGDEDEAAAIHFTLSSVFISLWSILLVGGTSLFSRGETLLALVVITLTTAGLELTETPQLILRRRVVHRRLALLQVANALLSTLVAVGLALGGATLWALLATNIVSLTVNVVGLYLWRPVWRVKLKWSAEVVRYFIRFGSRSFIGGILYDALDRVDDLWVGLFLGNDHLGFYSRAYSFATYPRKVLANPINQVALGTYAELKQDRERLSKAFFRINALLVRTGFLFAGALALIAPEFIYLLLGAKWAPMLPIFRLMLVFTLLDPLKIAVSHLLVAVGEPQKMVRARALQLAVMLIGLFSMGLLWGAIGVAIAVDAMIIIGIAFMLWQARTHVDFSIKRLFAVPTLALILGMVVARAAITIPGVLGSHWRTGSVKIGVFLTLYGIVFILLEREQILPMLHILKKLRPR